MADSGSKLADWDDDDPSMMANTSSKLEKVVILKHMFTLEEIKVRLPPPAPRGSDILSVV